MSINSGTDKDFTKPVQPLIATKVETTNLIFNFRDSAGYLRQVFKDADDNQLAVRFLKVTGDKYDNVESSILTKVQKVADDIELDNSLIDGVTIEEIIREDYFEGAR